MRYLILMCSLLFFVGCADSESQKGLDDYSVRDVYNVYDKAKKMIPKTRGKVILPSSTTRSTNPNNNPQNMASSSMPSNRRSIFGLGGESSNSSMQSRAADDTQASSTRRPANQQTSSVTKTTKQTRSVKQNDSSKSSSSSEQRSNKDNSIAKKSSTSTKKNTSSKSTKQTTQTKSTKSTKSKSASSNKAKKSSPISSGKRSSVVESALIYSKSAPRKMKLDNAGFINAVYSNLGLDLGTNKEKIAKAGKIIDPQNAKVGDILVFKNARRVFDLGIVIENSNGKLRMIHSTQRNRISEIDVMDTKFLRKRLSHAVDVIN